MFVRVNSKPSELRLLESELRRRNTGRAVKLREQVRQRLGELDNKNGGGHRMTRFEQHTGGAVNAPPIDPQAAEWLRKALAKLREKLIDLSKRNPLVSFKHSERGATYLRVIDELPDQLFEELRDGEMTFEPLPAADETPKDEQTPEFQIALERAKLTNGDYLGEIEKLGEGSEDEARVQEAERKLRNKIRAELGMPRITTGKGMDIAALARAHGFDPSFDLPADDGEEAVDHHQDSAIRVLLTADRLDTRLRTIFDRYRGHAAETGLHTLYVAFGFVEWFEDAESKTPLHAPALILPVHLERRLVRNRYVFTLSGRDEDLQVNMAMRELLKQRFHVDAPALRENETPESYFIRLKGALEEDPRARLTLRRFVTIAVLPFPKMVLWQDLDPEVWPEGYLDHHPLLPKLLGAEESGGGRDFLKDYPLDDPAFARRVPPIVLNADASQHSAVIDVVEGKSLAIEGPPGTGKSQTIGNMIAAAIDSGKRVLFVAEKQTALDVVAKRLKDIGFGPLLLQLHSDRATKQELHREVEERLLAKAPRGLQELEALRSELGEKKQTLRRYLALLHTPLGSLGRTAYQLVWREIALRAACKSAPPALHAERIEDAERIDTLQLKRARAALDALGAKASEISDRDGALDHSPWHAATSLPAFDQEAVLEAGKGALRELDAAIAEIDHLGHSGRVPLPPREDELKRLATHMVAFAEPKDLSDKELRAAIGNPQEATALLVCRAEWEAAKDLAEQVHPDPLRPSTEQLDNLDHEAAQSGEALTLAEARRIQADLKAGIAAIDRLSDALAPVLEQFQLTTSSPIRLVDAVIESLADIIELPQSSFDLRSGHLLDDHAKSAIAAAKSDAEALSGRAAELGRYLRIETALTCEASRMAALADTIETAGLFGRLFGGQYKLAWREAAALFTAPPERSDAVAFLRRLKQLIDDRATFRDQSPARRFFDEGTWRGADSDWASLVVVAETVDRIAERLSLLRANQVAEALATLGGRVLRPLARSASAAAPDRALLTDLSRDNLVEQRSAWVADLERVQRLIAAAEAVGLRDDAPFAQSGGTATSAIRRYQSADTSLRERPGEATLWAWFDGPETPLAGLAAAVEYERSLRPAELPQALSKAIRSAEDPASLIQVARTAGKGLVAALARWEQARADFCKSIAADPARFFGLEGQGHGLAAQRDRLAAALDDEEGVKLFASLGIYLREAEQERCRFVYDACLAGGRGLDQMADAYELILVRSLVRHFLRAQGEALERLGGLGLAAARKRFGELDDELQKIEAKRILARRIEEDNPRVPEGIGRGPRGTWTEKALLLHQIGLQRRHIPIRDLVERAGGALATLKPVWMMSPTSAAQYIKPGKAVFDLVLIDEASQMRPEYAVGSVARGGQLVVVGDSNQLPPTDFFNVSSPDMQDDEDEDYAIDTESILDLANEKLPHKRALNWHYRSEHESLIQFSNRRFYDRRLVIFPSPTRNDPLLGVQHRFVSNGCYEGQINEPEAKAVIEEAYGIMAARPELTMGIATMNLKQRELIRNEIERLEGQDKFVRDYIERHAGTIEPFIIKNLETIQGDERDVILISTVYGPDRNGNMFQRFGPLNSKVGHRRLNVLVTRAKQMTRVVTSLRPDQIKVTENSSEGVQATQAYLRHAAGGAEFETYGNGEPDSDFELFVAERLRGAGYDVDHQVGVEGFRIDLGVRHASFPLGYIAGVECDGASFHSGLTVRDRDKIRQSILERLGWNIHRVWSTDWFNSPDREMGRLVEALEKWREAAAASYESRRERGEFEEASPAEEVPPAPLLVPAQEQPFMLGADFTPPAEARPDSGEPAEVPPLIQPVDADCAPHGVEETTEDAVPRTMPAGKRRELDGIVWIEVMRGDLFEVWPDEEYAGDIEVLSRGTAQPRLYGGVATVQRSQYRGTVEATGATFIMDDLYAAVRRLAKEAREAR